MLRPSSSAGSRRIAVPPAKVSTLLFQRLASFVHQCRGKWPDSVELHDGLALGHNEMCALSWHEHVPACTQRYECLLIEFRSHPCQERSGQNRNVLVIGVDMRREAI